MHSRSGPIDEQQLGRGFCFLAISQYVSVGMVQDPASRFSHSPKPICDLSDGHSSIIASANLERGAALLGL